MVSIPVPFDYEEFPLYVDSYLRLFQAADCDSFAKLACLLGVEVEAIYEAMTANTIPAAWMLTLIRLRRSNPDWIILGSGPRFLVPSDDPAHEPGHGDGCYPVNLDLDSLVVGRVLRAVPERLLRAESRRRGHKRKPDGDPEKEIGEDDGAAGAEGGPGPE